MMAKTNKKKSLASIMSMASLEKKTGKNKDNVCGLLFSH